MYSTSLKGKKAWVTGSSRGIGRKIAEFLAECGADVAIHGRNSTNLAQYGEGETLEKTAEELSAKYGVQVLPVCADLTDENEVKQAAEKVQNVFGPLDILVCCAGGSNINNNKIGDKSILNFESEYFHGIMDMNLSPTVFCCREIVPAMMERGFGCVVTIGSIAACGGWKTGGHLAAYPLAKAAIHEYTRCLAAYTRHSNVRVNCVIPGNINTPVTKAKFGGDRANPVSGLSDLEHVGIPEDIASLVHFLCSEGGRYISGQCIRVDGAEQLSPC